MMREQQRQDLVKAVAALLDEGAALYTDWRDGVRA